MKAKYLTFDDTLLQSPRHLSSAAGLQQLPPPSLQPAPPPSAVVAAPLALQPPLLHPHDQLLSSQPLHERQPHLQPPPTSAFLLKFAARPRRRQCKARASRRESYATLASSYGQQLEHSLLNSAAAAAALGTPLLQPTAASADCGNMQIWPPSAFKSPFDAAAAVAPSAYYGAAAQRTLRRDCHLARARATSCF